MKPVDWRKPKAASRRCSLTRRVHRRAGDRRVQLSRSSAIAEYLEDILARRIPAQAWLRARRCGSGLAAQRCTADPRRALDRGGVQQRQVPPLSKPRRAARKLIAAVEKLLSHGRDNLFREWCIADAPIWR